MTGRQLFSLLLMVWGSGILFGWLVGDQLTLLGRLLGIAAFIGISVALVLLWNENRR